MMGWEYDRALDCKPKIEIQDVNTTILSCSVVKCIKYFKAYKNTWQIFWPKKTQRVLIFNPKKVREQPPSPSCMYSCYLPALPCVCMYCLCLCSRQNHPLENLWTSHFSYSYPFTSHFCLMALFCIVSKTLYKIASKTFSLSSCMVHVTFWTPLPTLFPLLWVFHLLYPQ